MTVEPPPTLYLSDRVNGFWPGIDPRCTVCLPAPNGSRPQLRLDEPEGKYPGSLICMTCGREPYTVKESREAGYTHINWGHHDAPKPKPERKPDANTSPRLGCGSKLSRPHNKWCRACFAAEQTRRALENRPPCEVCGEKSAYPESARFCESHLREHIRQRVAAKKAAKA